MSLRLPSRPSSRRLAWWARMSRRLLAACALAAAVTVVVRLAFPPPPPVGVLVPTAAHALSPGHVVTAGDVREVRWAGPDAPAAPPLIKDVVGRPVAVPVEAGDVLTPRLVVGPGLVRGPDRLAVPLTGLDPLVVSALRVGDRVQVWSGATLVSGGATVLTVDAPSGAGLGGPPAQGRSVLVALSTAEADRLHRARAGGPDPAPADVAVVGG